MKSLGPDAYIDREHPDEPPAHISKAIGEALGDLNMPNPKKPPDGVAPENRPLNSPNGAPPPRSSGRPRKTRIDSFNIDTDLELDERFREFVNLTSVTEAQALFSIMALYKYAARCRAIDGSLVGISPKLLEERCYWTPSEITMSFTQALIQSGILTDKLSISDWHDTQPHAKEYARKHRHYQKKKEQ